MKVFCNGEDEAEEEVYLKLSESFKKRQEEPAVECIEKGILEDVLIKHRAEVEDMFLTTFDKKMYEEALRQEGREELAKENEQLKIKLNEATTEIEKLREENMQLKSRQS